MISDPTLIDSIEIASELKNITEVEKLIDKICEQRKVSEDAYGNILIAVTEAVNNAVIHGNCFQKGEPVQISVTESANGLCFSVKDQGKGFDFEHLPDPTAPENLEKENGRGIFLIKNLADSLEFLDQGRIANIFFKHA